MSAYSNHPSWWITKSICFWGRNVPTNNSIKKNNYATLIIQYNTNLTLYLTILYDGHVFPLNCSKNIQIDNIIQKFFQRTIMWFLIEAILSDVSNIIMKLTVLIPEVEHLRMLQIRIFMCVKCNRLIMHPCTKYPT